MTTDKWGAAIEVTITNGQKPDMLADDQVCAVRCNGVWFGLPWEDRAATYVWTDSITAIRLLADDPYYKRGEELPPIEFRMEALRLHREECERAYGRPNWDEGDIEHPTIVALARVVQKLAALDPSIMPIDPDRECLAAMCDAVGRNDTGAEIRAGELDDDDRAAIAVIRKHCETREAAAVAKALAERGLA
jgi:hypothetical protein